MESHHGVKGAKFPLAITVVDLSFIVLPLLLWFGCRKIPWLYRVVIDSFYFSTRTVSEVADRACDGHNGKDPVILYPYGKRTLVFSSKEAAIHVLSTDPDNKNYRFRFATESGLNVLGMNRSGLIWNNDLDSWTGVRKCFDHALSSHVLDQLPRLVSEHLPRILDEMPRDNNGTIHMLDALRWMTLNLTLELMFGLPTIDKWDEAKKSLDEIVAFFKAWEFFLVRPYIVSRFRKGYHEHVQASKRLHEASEELLRKYEFQKQRQQGHNSSKRPTLLDKAFDLREDGKLSRKDFIQVVLESLLAGVDTSSVSLFYTLSFLAENSSCYHLVQKEIDEFIQGKSMSKLKGSSLPYTQACLKEAMRLKPVGPIIMRKAAKKDQVGSTPIFPGDQIIINLAKMNRIGVNDEFEPDRFLNEDTGDLVEHKRLKFGHMPFGDGPKGCVGRHFAMREMQAIMTVLFSKYLVAKPYSPTTANSMETRWDIAMQPQSEADTKMFAAPRSQKHSFNVFLTGPSSTGKTHLLDEQLRKSMGCATFHEETARIILAKKGMTGKDLLEDKQKHMRFQMDLVQQEFDSLEKKRKTGTIHVSDRSALDALVYMEHRGTEEHTRELRSMPEFQSFVQFCQDSDHCLVVLFPVVQELREDDEVRILGDIEEERRFFELFETTLKDLNIPYVVIGANLETRCNELLSKIHTMAYRLQE